MSSLAQRRARIADVRRVQHVQMVVAAGEAEQKLVSLETSNQRLAQLRASLTPGSGQTFGAALAGVGELSVRLDKAREGLAAPIAAARSRADAAAQLRLEARQRQEGADRLHERALAAAEAERERRLAALPIRRRKEASL